VGITRSKVLPDLFLCRPCAAAGWGFVSASLGNKHEDSKRSCLPTTQAVVIASAWIPKEDWSSLNGFIITLLSVLEDKYKVPLRERLSGIVMDGSKGAEKAVSLLLPNLPIVRDLRHVLAAARKKHGSVSGGYLAAEIQWTSNICSALTFHNIWSRILDQARERRTHLPNYIETEVLTDKAWAHIIVDILFSLPTTTTEKILVISGCTKKSSLIHSMLCSFLRT
jgi:hypothetical protein